MRMSLMLNKTVTVTAAAALLLAGCATPTSPPTDGTPQVLTALYPLEFLTQQVAGELASVTSVTPQGAEPHDLELAPAQVREIGAADLIVYIGGFQPALDDAVAQRPQIGRAACRGTGWHKVVGIARNNNSKLTKSERGHY